MEYVGLLNFFFSFLAKINSISVYASTIIQDLTRLLCYYPGAFHKTEHNGQYSSRYVCREGTICYVALDETYRNCYFVDFRRSELLGWYWGRAKAFRSSRSTTGMPLKFDHGFINDFQLVLVAETLIPNRTQIDSFISNFLEDNFIWDASL